MVHKEKLYMKVINYAWFILEEKATRSVKKNESNFITVTEDTFAVSNYMRKINNFILEEAFQLHKLCSVTYISNKRSN